MIFHLKTLQQVIPDKIECIEVSNPFLTPENLHSNKSQKKYKNLRIRSD